MSSENLNNQEFFEVLEGFNDPVVLIPIFILLGTLKASLPPSGKLSLRDKLVAFWYLVNGIIIHIFLDGFVGLFQRVPELYRLYCELDKRYSGTGESAVMLISGIELLVMGPLCLLLFHAYCRNKSYKYILEIIVCTIQIMGTVIFTGTEIYDDFPNIDTDWEMTFTPSRIVFFWIFFVAANLLWFLLPLRLLATAWSQIMNIIANNTKVNLHNNKKKI